MDTELEDRLRQLSGSAPDLRYLLDSEAPCSLAPVPQEGQLSQLPVPETKDLRADTSWTAKIGEARVPKHASNQGLQKLHNLGSVEVSWVETVEVQVINVTAPFVLLSELKSSLIAEKAGAV